MALNGLYVLICVIFAFCKCSGLSDENKDGPYYTQLGAAPSIDGVRQLMQTRLVAATCSTMSTQNENPALLRSTSFGSK